MRRRNRIQYDPPHARKSGFWRRAGSAMRRPEQLAMSRRMFVAKGAVVAAFATLATRVGIMQLLDGDTYRTQAANNIRRGESIKATRGLIYDRKGREIAVNQQMWEVRVLPGELPDDAAQRQLVLDELKNALNLPDALVLDPRDVPKGAEEAVYARTAQLLGKTLTVEPTPQTVQYPFFKTIGQIVRVNGADLLVFIYLDETARKADMAKISVDGRLVAGQEVAWPATPQFASGGNVSTVLLSPDKRLAARVARAIDSMVEVNKGACTLELTIASLQNDALQAWKDYIVQQEALNYIIRLEDELTTDQAALCRAHLNELPGVTVMNRLDFLVRNGTSMERITVKTGVPREVALKLEANRAMMPGIELDGGVLVRRYPGGSAMSHILGFVGKVSQRELDSPVDRDEMGRPIYEPDDYIGKDGLERTLESSLRGTSGQQMVELDLSGASWRVLPETVVDPVPGENVTLTVDLEFQRAVAEILERGIQFSNADRAAIADLDPTRSVKKFSGAGSVVAIDPRNGEVLAMVSYPLYDNQLFVDGISDRKYQEYVSDEANKPLIDRSLRGIYPPGSTLKPFLAAVGLNDKKIDLKKTYYCGGAIQVPLDWDQSKGNTHPCWIWRAGGHDSLDVMGAIEQSCDVFFYNVGAPRQPLDANKSDYLHYRDLDLVNETLGDKHYFEGLGIDAIHGNLRDKFWFGQQTGIDLPTEAEGTVPNAESHARLTQGGGWSLGDTIIVSIGQGEFLATPLQMALNTAALANGGQVMKPLLLRETFNEARTRVQQQGPVLNRKVDIAAEWIDAVREGMRRVVHGGLGTARANIDNTSKWVLTNPAGEPEIIIGGKTGTAEIGNADENGLYDRQHAWFVCFAPFENPEIAISVIVEDGGEGSSYAVPVADRVMRAYFELTGRRTKGTVLRTDLDVVTSDEPVLADAAAFPQPGLYASSATLSTD